MFNRLTENQKVLLQAIDDKSADLMPLERFIVKTAVRRNPTLADDAIGYARAMAESEGEGALGDGELLKYIIEHLPEIAAFIATLFKLFGGL